MNHQANVMMLVILHLAFAIVVEYDITFKGGNLVDRKHIELNNSKLETQLCGSWGTLMLWIC
jgi:hypothetical protein